ncbi:O-acetyl-ADP-ribose deacetylase [Ekhidna sp.]|uniref:O-acetyl-ADP-ribose deacetylase n=1 Tax=Ekhidna sp. TaxID=2608089 RepID=UPI003CCC3216
MKIKLIQEDITKLRVDAIVNAANSSLLGGGGVDGAIHRAGGFAILEECKEIGGCETGQAVITTGGNLPAKYVIHTVGPVWKDGNSNEEELLRSCYIQSLIAAADHDVKTIAFPNISTGIYGFPKERAAEIAIENVSSFSSHVIQEVTFVCFEDENFHLYKNLLNK